MFLKIEGIQGETLDVHRQTEIEIQGWGWEVWNPIKWNLNQGGQSTKAHIKEMTVTKICDQASVALYQYCVTGKHFKSARIICRKNDGDNKVEYLTIEMDDVMIQSVNWSGQGDSPILNETLELAFAEFNLLYRTQQDSGDAKGGIQFGFNIQKQLKK